MGLKRLIIILFLLAWAGAIYWVSGITFSTEAIFQWFHEHIFRSEESFQAFQRWWLASWGYISNAMHLIEFGVLMFLCTLALDNLTGTRSPRNLLIAAALCLAYAVSDEWHQAFVPKRNTSFSDILMDALGIAIVGLFLFRRRRAGRSDPREDEIVEETTDGN